MNLLKSVETTIANLVEGAFGRVFRSEVRPIELARKLTREMDAHRTVSVSRTYVPNEYSVWLSPADRERYTGVEHEVIDELCAYLLEHARREDLILSSPPTIAFHTDERLALGEFGIQARLVRPEDQAGTERRPAPSSSGTERRPAPSSSGTERRPAPSSSGMEPPRPPAGDGEGGNTMIYSTSARVSGPLTSEPGRRRTPRALLVVEGRRLLVPPSGGTIGRSRDCEIVLQDSGISRHHAALRPVGEGWELEDLGSTNGLLLNGRELRGSHPLAAGDVIEMGSTAITFELG